MRHLQDTIHDVSRIKIMYIGQEGLMTLTSAMLCDQNSRPNGIWMFYKRDDAAFSADKYAARNAPRNSEEVVLT